MIMEQESQREEPPLVEEIKMLYGIAQKRFGIQLSDRVVPFAQHLQKSYPDYLRWRAYHALARSTILPEHEADVIEDDFPGDDSIVKFLQSLVLS